MKDIFRAILRSQTRLIFDYVDVFEVSHFSVEVKAVSDYEFGRNGESHVVGFEAGLGAFGLMEEGHESNGIGIVFFEVVDHLCCRQTRVDDVFDDDHVSAVDIFGQAYQLFHFPCRGQAAVARISDERYGGIVQPRLPKEVGGENEGSVEHAEEVRPFPLKVFSQFSGYPFHLLADFLACNIRYERQSVDYDFVFHLSTTKN